MPLTARPVPAPSTLTVPAVVGSSPHTIDASSWLRSPTGQTSDLKSATWPLNCSPSVAWIVVWGSAPATMEGDSAEEHSVNIDVSATVTQAAAIGLGFEGTCGSLSSARLVGIVTSG